MPSIAPTLHRRQHPLDSEPAHWDALAGAMGAVPWFEGPDNSLVVNASRLPNALVEQALLEDSATAGMIKRVVSDLNGDRQKYRLNDRTDWQRPRNRIKAMEMARQAFEEDDVVVSWVDMSEALAFTRAEVFSEHEEEEARWNQILKIAGVPRFLRRAWQRLEIDSQVACVMWWERRRLRDTGYDANGKRKRTGPYVQIPTALAVLDTTKVIPVGELMWGKERLAYQATPLEADRIDEALEAAGTAGLNEDEDEAVAWFMGLGSDEDEPMLTASQRVLSYLFSRRYPVDDDERVKLQRDGITLVDYLYEFRPGVCWRHTLTRPNNERFAVNRLGAKAFHILDMKKQLRHNDRALLQAGANFIVLVTKGSDAQPAEPSEITNLKAQSETLGMNSVVVGDHRLKIQIVSPNIDVTLDPKRWNTLDDSLKEALTGAVLPGTDKATDPMKVARLVAVGVESRRADLAVTVEEKMFGEIMRRNPRVFTAEPFLLFTPETVQLAFDPAFASFLLDLGDRGDVSRMTSLGTFNVDARRETIRRIRAARANGDADYEPDTALLAHQLSDDQVHQTQVPYSAPVGTSDPAAGPDPDALDEYRRVRLQRMQSRAGGRRRGGTHNGGGADPSSNQGGTRQNEPEDPRAAAAELVAEVLADVAEVLGMTISVERTEDDT